ncbi:ABC transporter ATP-binding protein [Egicoccus halophilus]|uniref:ABC transporter ATP-binding protein n=1 Tax=Egicoccus halophilus TaxID=1670830 RepID=A0A8J3A9N7_9ACTN|nr:ABC transporter ATP-binding protein [Egicoccus halophilus]GGI05416.1 ABC transporter ATP-binding protein [Egicoccus halophilus]
MVEGARRYLRLIDRDLRARWVGVVVLAIVVGGVEALGAVLVFGLVSIATEAEGTIELPVLGDVRALLPPVAHERLVVGAAIAVAGFFLLRAGLVLWQKYFQTRATQLVGVQLATRLLQRYLRLPYAFHLQRNSAELIRNTNDSVGEILGSVVVPAVRILSDGLLVLAMVAVLLVTAPGATLLVLAFLTPLVWVTLMVVQPRMKRLGRAAQLEATRSYQTLQQGLHGYRDITVLGRQDYFLDRFADARREIARIRWRRAVLSDLPRVSIEAVVVLFLATFIGLSAVTGDGTGNTIPVLGLFAYAALRIMPSLNHIVSSLNSMRFGRAALDDVEADLDLPLAARASDDQPMHLHAQLRFEQVTFVHPGADEPTLEDIDLVIRHGESIGLVGATGAGKSTMVDLLVGLAPPTSGRITVDGVDLAGREAAWQRSIGLVSQHVFLLDDTLERNVALGVPDTDIDARAVREALDLAQLTAFVDTLPDGLETRLGERGVRLSGGQQQRVAIARALYRRPSVLVFDEGTSALDNLTESALIDALDGLRETHTIVTVAHRLSTVQDYDRIVFLEAGRIVAVGPFDELTRTNAAFRRLARWSDTAV